MCFSTVASFTGGIAIAVIGVATITKIHKPSQIVFASIPLFFAFQQIVEGFVWLSIENPNFAAFQNAAMYIYLVMAEVFWPMMIPLAIYLMEDNPMKKRWLVLLLGLGIMLSLYYILCLISFNVTPIILGYHIEYVDNFPKTLRLIAFSIYLITSITPLFISSIKRTKLLGTLMFLSCVITIIFFTQYLTSVWCFFAAIISVIIFWILRDARKKYMFAFFE